MGRQKVSSSRTLEARAAYLSVVTRHESSKENEMKKQKASGHKKPERLGAQESYPMKRTTVQVSNKPNHQKYSSHINHSHTYE